MPTIGTGAFGQRGARQRREPTSTSKRRRQNVARPGRHFIHLRFDKKVLGQIFALPRLMVKVAAQTYIQTKMSLRIMDDFCGCNGTKMP
jgi:hypothetical protein